MKHRKAPIIPIVLIVLLFAGVVYAKNQQPVVGTLTELDEMRSEKMEAEAKAKMKEAIEKPVGDSRSGPSAAEVAASMKLPDNLNAKKIKKVEKAKVPLIWNTRQRATKEAVNDAAPYQGWWDDSSGRPKPK